MTGAPAGLAGAGAAVVTALTTMRGTLTVLAWLAGMIIRQSRAAHGERARQRARR
jgi:hypothetical protein